MNGRLASTRVRSPSARGRRPALTFRAVDEGSPIAETASLASDALAAITAAPNTGGGGVQGRTLGGAVAVILLILVVPGAG